MLKRVRVAIVDYEVGNHTSVKNTLDRLGFLAHITSQKSELEQSDLLLLPGVGAFPTAMGKLDKLGLTEFIKTWSHKGRPLLGICLGMQLLADSSNEGRPTRGLGLIEGEVYPISPSNLFHIGWNELRVARSESAFVPFEGESFYFNHAYAFGPNTEGTVAECTYHRPFPTVVRHGLTVGIQFHPEKSQGMGQELLSLLVKEMVSVT